MKNPITITSQLIGTEETNAVNARELHEALSIKKDFSNWMKQQIKSLGMEENIDYASFALKGEREIGATIRIEYILTLDAAKHIAMASRSAKGKEVRAYFIEVEKRYRSQLAGGETIIAAVVANLDMLGEVVVTLSQQMDRLDRRLQVYEQIEAHRREQARQRAGKRKSTNALVAQAYEGRRAQFLTLVHAVLQKAGGTLNQSELLRRAGYRRDDRTARRWLQESAGIYWTIKSAGGSLLYRTIAAGKEVA